VSWSYFGWKKEQREEEIREKGTIEWAKLRSRELRESIPKSWEERVSKSNRFQQKTEEGLEAVFQLGAENFCADEGGDFLANLRAIPTHNRLR
jgi:hypothetical protein